MLVATTAKGPTTAPAVKLADSWPTTKVSTVAALIKSRSLSILVNVVVVGQLLQEAKKETRKLKRLFKKLKNLHTNEGRNKCLKFSSFVRCF